MTARTRPGVVLGSMRNGARAHLGEGVPKAAHGMLMPDTRRVVELLVPGVELKLIAIAARRELLLLCLRTVRREAPT